MHRGHAVAKLLAASEATRTVSFVLSTSKLDRTNDTIDQNGWKLDNYRKNPVLLWGHDRWTPPIGRAVEIGITGRGLEATYQFATAEEHPLADTVYRLLKGGYLNAGSVGFSPLKYVWNEQTGGIDFTEQELLEFSVVTVPCNPEAIVSAKQAGIDLALVSRALEASPDTSDPFAELRANLAKKAAPAASQLGRFKARSKALALKARHAGV